MASSMGYRRTRAALLTLFLFVTAWCVRADAAAEPSEGAIKDGKIDTAYVLGM